MLAEVAGAGDPGERPRLRPVFNRADPFVAHLAEALRGATLAAFVVPSEHLRSVAVACARQAPGALTPPATRQAASNVPIARLTVGLPDGR